MKVSNLSYHARGKQVFSAITFDIVDSPLVLITGKNGTGKSTLLKVLLGVLTPSQGQVSRNGRISYVPDSSEQYFVGMTPQIFFYFLGRQYGLAASQLDERIQQLSQEFSFAETLLDQTIKTLSLGQQKKTMLIAAFLAEPDVIVMDEPFSGLDEDSQSYLAEKIKDQLNLGRQFIIVTHDHEALLADVVSHTINLSRGQGS